MSRSATSTRARRRAAAWSVLAVLVALRLVLPTLGLPERAELALTDTLTYLLPIAVTSVLLYILAFKTLGSIEHRLWGPLAIASTLVLVAESHWTWYAYAIDAHGPDVASPLQALHLVAIVLFGWVVLNMTTYADHPGLVRARLVVDIAAASVVLFALTLAYWTGPALVLAERGGAEPAVVIALYPVAGVLIWLSTVSIFVGWKSHRWRPWERLMASALMLFALGLAAMPAWYPALLSGDGLGPTWFTTVLGAAYWLLAVAAVYRLTAVASDGIAEPWPLPSRVPLWVGRLFPLLLLAAVPLLGYTVLVQPNGEVSTALLVAVVLLAALLVIRSWISAFIRAGYARQSTGSANDLAVDRELFFESLGEQLAVAAARGGEVSLILLMVMDRSRYGAALGHSAGETVLSRAAALLSELSCDAGGAHRVSTDEFAIVCSDVGPHEAASLARRWWLRLRSEFAGSPVPFDAVAGIAAYPEDGPDPDTLLAAARDACLHATGSDSEPVELFRGSEDVGDHALLLDKARMRTSREMIRSLAHAVDARLVATRDHSANVAELATALAQVLDLSDSEVQVVGIAALMHDVGKVGMRDSLLTNTGFLTLEERSEIESHPVLGERILAPAGFSDVLAPVRHHHERWDGQGYPDRLRGIEIPLLARILAVCDTFECLATGRPDRDALPARQAIEAIERAAGTKFDPIVAGAFARLMRRIDATGAPIGGRSHPQEASAPAASS